MGLVEAVCQEIKKASNACTRNPQKDLRQGGCKVSLKDAPQPRLVISFDVPGSPPGQNQKCCDYLFVAEVSGKPSWVVPLELKGGGRPDISETVQQLQAGARAAESLVPAGTKVDFRPVLACRSMAKMERRDLRRKVKFRGRSEAIQRINCGDQLVKALQGV